MNRKQADELRHKKYESFYVTEAGLAQLKEKLAYLKRVLPDRAAEVARTAAYGDRSENDEYKQAKGTLRRTQHQILTIEDQIKRAAMIKPDTNASGIVQLGSTVTLEMNGTEKIFQIVGPHETDPAKGRISHLSPLGAALMHKKPNDIVALTTGAGEQTYRIIEIK
jgi:transcription elongation factor GreA